MPSNGLLLLFFFRKTAVNMTKNKHQYSLNSSRDRSPKNKIKIRISPKKKKKKKEEENSLTHMAFQTFMIAFLLQNTKENNLKNVGNHQTILDHTLFGYQLTFIEWTNKQKLKTEMNSYCNNRPILLHIIG